MDIEPVHSVSMYARGLQDVITWYARVQYAKVRIHFATFVGLIGVLLIINASDHESKRTMHSFISLSHINFSKFKRLNKANSIIEEKQVHHIIQ